MKKIINHIHTLAALLIAGAAFTACSNDDLADTTAVHAKYNQTYTFTVETSKAKGGTRALALDGTTGDITSKWKQGDVVSVYTATNLNTAIGTLTAQADGESTTLTGSITAEGISEGSNLVLKYCAPEYDKQDGTLQSISDKCDYSVANVTVKITDENHISPAETADFLNQQAIVKFTILDASDATTKLSPSQFSLTALKGETQVSAQSLTIPEATYTTNGAGVIYVAVPIQTCDKLSFSATVGDFSYSYEKNGNPFTQANFYVANIKMTIGQKAGTVSFGETSEVTKTYGDDNFTIAATVTGDATISYSSSNTAVAEVDETTGEVTIVGDGTTTIIATVSDTKKYTYTTKSVSYTLNVSQANSSFAFQNTEVIAQLEDGGYQNPLVADADPLAVSYSSSDTSVATVDADGIVSFVKAGVCTITATITEGYPHYKYASLVASYQLTILSDTPSGNVDATLDNQWNNNTLE